MVAKSVAHVRLSSAGPGGYERAMPVIFVHGVPDTPHVWHRVLAALHRSDVVVPALPGFGSPPPDGFAATKEAYVDWLLGVMAAQGEPVDLVGHDWGGMLVVRAASLRPDLVRTWAAGAACVDPDYEWHETARVWQTPEQGEAFMEMMTADAMTVGFEAAGVPADDAAVAAGRIDATMKRCILALYRSAVHAGTEWTPDLARIPARGTVLWGEDDMYASARFGERLAERTRARFVGLAGCGHWWPLERPAEVAAALRHLWADQPSR
jgi:pimeloyl-ACP methyl ester carboxylesterase